MTRQDLADSHGASDPVNILDAGLGRCCGVFVAVGVLGLECNRVELCHLGFELRLRPGELDSVGIRRGGFPAASCHRRLSFCARVAAAVAHATPKRQSLQVECHRASALHNQENAQKAHSRHRGVVSQLQRLQSEKKNTCHPTGKDASGRAEVAACLSGGHGVFAPSRWPRPRRERKAGRRAPVGFRGRKRRPEQPASCTTSRLGMELVFESRPAAASRQRLCLERRQCNSR